MESAYAATSLQPRNRPLYASSANACALVGASFLWLVVRLNWSLDLYEQFNARVRRQGQGVPVICHRILMQATLDQAQALALDEKAQTQAGLRNAIKQYRLQKGR